MPLSPLQKIASEIGNQIGKGFPLLGSDILQFLLHALWQCNVYAIFTERFSTHRFSVNHTHKITRLTLYRQYIMCMIHTYKFTA